MTRTIKTYLVLSCLSVVVSGCGSNQLRTYPLTVRVTYGDETPLVGATVVFRSLAHKVTATGATGADGTCTLGTYRPGDGIVAGEHQASVALQTPPGDPDEVQTPITIPTYLSNPNTSELEYTITKDGPREITIELPLP